jgi:long-chain acyl-CoA synthetase
MAASAGVDIIRASDARTLTGLLLERVRRSAERIAYVHCDAASGLWIESSWRRTLEQAGRWQAALRREGLSPGDRVAIQMSNRPEWVHFDMAALGLGLVTVPLYTKDRAENVHHILEDAGVRLLLLQDEEQLATLTPTLARLEQLERILVLEPSEQTSTVQRCSPVAEWIAGASGELVDLVRTPEDLATIVYTSGTLGPPKGVMLSHSNLLWNAEAALSRVQAFPSDRFLSFLPLSHTLERTGGYYLPMMAGSSVAYARSIPQLAEDLQILRPTVLISVPRIFERIRSRILTELADKPAPARRLFHLALEVGWHAFEYAQRRRRWSADLLLAPLLDRLVGRKIRRVLGGRLRVAVTGGAPIAPQVARFFIGLGIPLVQGYGLTEASPVVSVSPLDDNVPESVGISLPGVEVRIGDQDELIVRSPGIMLGYWKHPQETAAVVDADRWLHTGDQARMDGGHIFITGRIKELIVLASGEKVAPAELEMAIAMDGLFSQVLILGEGRPYPVALVVLEEDAYAELASEEDLSSDPDADRHSPRLEAILVDRIERRLRTLPCHARIPRLAVVRGSWTIEEGLLTPTLKLIRARILDRHREEVERLYEGHR